jgi:hypothetical protein
MKQTAVVILLSLAAGPALALPPLFDAGSTGGYNAQTVDGFGTFVFPNATLATGLTPTPFASVSGNISGLNNGVEAGDSVTYYFRAINVPSGIAVVPIVIRSIGHVTTSTDATAFSERYVFARAGGNVSTDFGQFVFGTSVTGPGSDSFDQTGTLNTIAGATGGVLIQTALSAFGTDGGSSSASAFVDPVITVDPAFLALHPDVTIEFSRGVGNGFPTPAPGPASLALFGLGLGGFALRRRS